MSGRPPLHRKVKKARVADPPPPPPPPPTLAPDDNTPPYLRAPFKFPFFPKEKGSFDPNFNVRAYARNKGLDVFRFNPATQNSEIQSRHNNDVLYFPNSLAAEIQHRGYEEAMDENDPSKLPVPGDKLIYVEYTGPTTEVTVLEIDIPYITLKNDYNDRVFILNINNYGGSYMLYKKKSMYEEEPVNWAAQGQNFFENMGGSRGKSRRTRTKHRNLKRKTIQKRTRKNVR
jgi:hypothetical protein